MRSNELTCTHRVEQWICIFVHSSTHVVIQWYGEAEVGVHLWMMEWMIPACSSRNIMSWIWSYYPHIIYEFLIKLRVNLFLQRTTILCYYKFLSSCQFIRGVATHNLSLRSSLQVQWAHVKQLVWTHTPPPPGAFAPMHMTYHFTMAPIFLEQRGAVGWQPHHHDTFIVLDLSPY